MRCGLVAVCVLLRHRRYILNHPVQLFRSAATPCASSSSRHAPHATSTCPSPLRLLYPVSCASSGPPRTLGLFPVLSIYLSIFFCLLSIPCLPTRINRTSCTCTPPCVFPYLCVCVSLPLYFFVPDTPDVGLSIYPTTFCAHSARSIYIPCRHLDIPYERK